MNLSTTRKWMLAYSILILLISIYFLSEDILDVENETFYIVWMLIHSILFNIGNFVYSLNYKSSLVFKYWRFVFPLLIMSSYYDLKYSWAEIQSEGLIIAAITIVFMVLFLFPGFRAHYMLAYRNKQKLAMEKEEAEKEKEELDEIIRKAKEE